MITIDKGVCIKENNFITINYTYRGKEHSRLKRYFDHALSKSRKKERHVIDIKEYRLEFFLSEDHSIFVCILDKSIINDKTRLTNEEWYLDIIFQDEDDLSKVIKIVKQFVQKRRGGSWSDDEFLDYFTKRGEDDA